MIKERQIGRIFDYNGQVGTIITIDNKYTFSKQDTKDNLKKGDDVEFTPNTIVFGNETLLVAKFIEKVNNKVKTKNLD